VDKVKLNFVALWCSYDTQIANSALLLLLQKQLASLNKEPTNNLLPIPSINEIKDKIGELIKKIEILHFHT